MLAIVSSIGPIGLRSRRVLWSRWRRDHLVIHDMSLILKELINILANFLIKVNALFAENHGESVDRNRGKRIETGFEQEPMVLKKRNTFQRFFAENPKLGRAKIILGPPAILRRILRVVVHTLRIHPHTQRNPNKTWTGLGAVANDSSGA